MSELSGTKVDSAHSAGQHGQHGQHGQNELWYPKAHTYIYILYICLGFGVPKFMLPMLPGSMGRMGRMNFGTPKAVTSPPGP